MDKHLELLERNNNNDGGIKIVNFWGSLFAYTFPFIFFIRTKAILRNELSEKKNELTSKKNCLDSTRAISGYTN